MTRVVRIPRPGSRRCLAGTALMALALLTAPAPAVAQQTGTGLGIIVGEPTGLSVKLRSSGRAALAAAGAWSARDRDDLDLHVHLDWVLETDVSGRVGLPGHRLFAYYGLGVRIVDRHRDTRIGLRVPLGITHYGRRVPLEVFAEVAPVLDVVPATELEANVGVGVRFWF